MRKTLLMCSFGLIALGLSSCNSQRKTTPQRTKVETLSSQKLKGDWRITSIDYDSKKFKIKPFGEGIDARCFIGSVWTLVPNNNSGAYRLSATGNCPSISQDIKFEVTKNKEFRFKKLEQNVKAKHITEGYVLQLENHHLNHFTLVQNVLFEGQNIEVRYQFEKILTK
ncbi:MAG: lipocalin family protein [Flavobacteriaceae bacterium]|nr:lipocalin family protein [Flavobacteriaceae bacterium]